jgi:hypothetical protein
MTSEYNRALKLVDKKTCQKLNTFQKSILYSQSDFEYVYKAAHLLGGDIKKCSIFSEEFDL